MFFELSRLNNLQFESNHEDFDIRPFTNGFVFNVKNFKNSKVLKIVFGT